MKPGEIYLGQFPFGDVAGMKLRPVLVLSGVTGPAEEVLVAYVSSVIPASQLATDLLLDPGSGDDRDTRLKTVSVVRLHKLATIHRTSLSRFLGVLSPQKHAAALDRLRDWLRL